MCQLDGFSGHIFTSATYLGTTRGQYCCAKHHKLLLVRDKGGSLIPVNGNQTLLANLLYYYKMK